MSLTDYPTRTVNGRVRYRQDGVGVLMKKFVLVLALILLIIVLVLLTKKSNSPTIDSSSPSPSISSSIPTPSPSPSPTPSPQLFDFSVTRGVVQSPAAFTVTQGQQLTIRVTSDTVDEVHLHGYDLSADIVDERAELSFTASTAGRFELELEDARISLGYLIVQPK